MSASTIQTSRANYGLDAPGLVRNLLLAGVGALIIGLVAITHVRTINGSMLVQIAATAASWYIAISGLTLLVTGLLMIWSSRFGKLQARDHLLDDLHLQGDETVLDLGTGRGLLLMGAAKRLPRGRALGLDLWMQRNLNGNRKDIAFANAVAEGVADRVEIYDGDMRKVPFADNSVDVVTASLSIHNIYNREGRRNAINEIVRVLKPGGKVALMDIRHIHEYALDLQVAGIQDIHISNLNYLIFPPARIVTGSKV
ncbi:class I SAM-dependent methyltransferase [Ktedonosporobacter rubrisoli]|uniref:Class I SAM-dependent methyltransferase n=1 Tax=Ktedonosporobacter rubrisoli TaxID=2509675 RepID=A0A4P6JXL4_KTERU|nr:class I SAM-dependent methyltransferase [Ktedonosporobacter rubrisoli]QBD80498.1 class I SAM-dependent methyltransferase [Ktedonosporobacter rubrisoli]